jgi:cell division protein FtsZ
MKPGGESDQSVAIIGLGSAGCKIVADLKNLNPGLGSYFQVSCDPSDLSDELEHIYIEPEFRGVPSPRHVRLWAQNRLDRLRSLVVGRRLAILAAGLGGAAGSALAPLMAQLAQEAGTLTLAVVVMPFSFEKSKHFRAGVALRQLRRLGVATLVIDNEELVEAAPHTPLTEAFAKVNRRISSALTCLTQGGRPGLSGGLSRVLEVLGGGNYGLLTIREPPSEDLEEALAGAARALYRETSPEWVEQLYIYISGAKVPSVVEVRGLVEGVEGLFGEKVALDVGVGEVQAGATVILLAAARASRFDYYDPLALLDGQAIDDSPEMALPAGVMIPPLTQLE